MRLVMTAGMIPLWRKVAVLAAVFGVMAIMPKEGCNRIATDTAITWVR
jgi:hypothetical protein